MEKKKKEKKNTYTVNTYQYTVACMIKKDL